MKITSLIVDGIVPLAVAATTQVAPTTNGPIQGSGQSEAVAGEGIQQDSFAARRRSAKNTPREDIRRRARQIRPTSPNEGIFPEDAPIGRTKRQVG